MSRSVWKVPFVSPSLLEKVNRAIASGKMGVKIKTWARSSTILPKFVGLTFEVHNGRMFIPVFVTDEMIGRKLGEFSPTRTFRGHAGDKKAKKR